MQNLFSDYFLPVTLAIITLGMGLSVTLKDFKNVFFRPRAVIIGICCQILLLPMVAFGIALLTDIDPLFKVGLIIIAACPGGATSNLITYLLEGNVALSISMTALNSLITLVSIPVNVSIALAVFIHTDADIHLPVLETILKIFLITIVPAYIGIRIRNRRTELADKLHKPLKVILPFILLLVYLGVLFIDEGAETATRMDFINLFPHAIALNIASMLLGWMIARIAVLKWRDRYTIAIEVGLQNSALAIFVASTLLNNPVMAMVAVVYGSFTFFSTGFLAWGIKRVSKEFRGKREKLRI
jgi:BASS family bile acid:Na+ symporter